MESGETRQAGEHVTAGRIGCLLLLWPIAELVILLVAASTWGWEPVVIALLIGVVVGLIVIRIGIAATGRSWGQALRVLQQRSVIVDPDTGQVLAIEGPDSATSSAAVAPPAQTVLLIPAGIAIAIPGFISDIVGLVLLLPPVRRRIAQSWARRIGPA